MKRALEESPTVEARADALGVTVEPPSGEDVSTPSPSSPRQKIGRYELLFELARGGMGSVHVGRVVGDHGFDRLVALKLLPKERASRDDFAAFAAEARITARINHPNVVDTFEFGLDEGVPFLAMQFIEGVPLSRLLEELRARDELLDPDLAAWIAAQAALGLHAAHELSSPTGESLGIVHRDVSPQNLLLSFEGRVYVADFGVAKLLEGERATASGVIKGKFSYMSPEQTRAELVDRRSDVFALGAVLHETLTGKAVFSGASPAESVFQINNAEPRPAAELRAEVQEDLSRAVERCLLKSRERRFDSALEVAEALRSGLRSRRAVVDESDLASLLKKLFGDERKKLKARIRAAWDDPAATAGASEPPPRPSDRPPETHLSHGSVTATVGSIVLPRRSLLGSPWLWGAGLAAAAAIGLVIWFSGESPPAPTAASPHPVETANPSPPPEREITPPTGPTAHDAPPSPAESAEASAPSASHVVHGARPPVPAKSAEPRQNATPPAPSATSPSHKGEPFRALDHG